jgi:zinc transport system substrate-binding protein
MRIIVMSPRRLALALSATVLVSACGATADDGKRHVVAAFYPLQFVSAQVGGSAVSAMNLVRPGVEPHDLEPGPAQVTAVADADLVVYLRGFQPAVDDLVDTQAEDRALDIASVQHLRGGFTPLEDGDEKGTDPHVWLDPARLAAIGDAVAKRLATQDEANAAGYTARAADLRKRLEALDAEYRSGLAQCEQRAFVVSHNAFGYLAERYHLEQHPIVGFSPDAEPTAEALDTLARFARDHKVRVVFFERLASDKAARTLASEVGARTDVLDPLEGLSEGSSDDYFSVMRTNLSKLRTALGCS